MSYTITRVDQPIIEPVTLEEMRLHLRCIDGVTTDDDLIESLIVGAREWAENFTGRALIEQSWLLSIDGETLGNGINLRRSPAISITSISTIDASGEDTEIDSELYELRDPDSKAPRAFQIGGAAWDKATYHIIFSAGYSGPVDDYENYTGVIPVRFKQAIKFWVEAMYDRDQVMMPLLLKAAEDLIRPERIDLSIA